MVGNRDASNDARHIEKEGAEITTQNVAQKATHKAAGRIETALVGSPGPVTSKQYQHALRLEQHAHGGESISLYVHLPFCPSRCLTCDHQTSVTHDPREIDRYLDGIEREIALVTDQLGARRPLRQLHLGGGTPNYLSDTQLVRLIDIIERHFDITATTEASLDANAHRASQAQLSLLHGLGFRAINLEIRDLNPEVQEAVGRSQSLAVIRDVADSARDLGFERVATDLVYGLPRQTAASIQRTLEQLLSLEPDRISCYSHARRQYAFDHQRAVDPAQIPSLADKVAMFSRIVDVLCKRDYQWVGLDCFARREDPIVQAQRAGELHRNWIGYSTHGTRRVLGIGCSSPSDLSAISVRNHPTIDRWQQTLEQGELPVSEGELLSEYERAQRDALSDLMCNLESTELAPLLDNAPSPAIQSMLDQGLLSLGSDRITVTEHGRFMLHRLWGDSAPAHRWSFMH